MGQIVVGVEDIRKMFKQFSDADNYPDDLILSYIEQAYCFCSPENYGMLRGACRKLAIEYMVAHLMTLDGQDDSKTGNSGIVTSATIDYVSVGFAYDNSAAWWYNQTTWGRKFRALCLAKVPVGNFVGGRFQRYYKGDIVGL